MIQWQRWERMEKRIIFDAKLTDVQDNASLQGHDELASSEDEIKTIFQRLSELV